ncbi:MAG: DUF1059 domain-containing protein [Chloroflexota bacterium]
MAKTIACRDIGIDCDNVARGETTDEVMERAADHAARVHNIKVISPEFMRKIEAAIHDERPHIYT